MSKTACHHQWAMTNLRSGYLVIEGCFHCRNRISFFSQEPVAPIDDYHEGEHFWSHLAHYQASQFDLKCEKCSAEMPLKDVMALMLCVKCNPECGVYAAGAQELGQKTWVYAALCADTSHSTRKCIPPESIRALNEYFNQGIKDPAKKIVVVPCSSRKSVDTCQGIVLADFGLTDLY
ncbi:MAG: hypothetical protein NTX53_01675 [candidate division WOR-3 bacterium]|nr:hypothetical protein [candidate division WOR-3 bacterium]